MAIPNHFTHVDLDRFAILPDHIHGILLFTGHPESTAQIEITNPGVVLSGSLSAVIRSYKSAVTKAVNIFRQTPGMKFWQRNYYDRIIWDEESLRRIR